MRTSRITAAILLLSRSGADDPKMTMKQGGI